MFIRRRKLLLLLAALGTIWIIATFFLARESKVVAKSSNRHSALMRYDEYGESNEELIVKPARAREFHRKVVTTAPFFERVSVQQAKLDHAMEQADRREQMRKEHFKREEREKNQLEEEEEEGEEEYIEESKEVVTKKTVEVFQQQERFMSMVARVTVKRRMELQDDVQEEVKKTPLLEKVVVAKQKQGHPPGYNGEPVHIDPNELSPSDRKQYDESLQKFSHNEFISKKISLHRSLPDVRDAACHRITYGGTLPEASIIIAFYNEAWTTLLRTIHSIFDRSPPNLIKEVILVDDFSDYENLNQQLEDYLALLPKVRLIRTPSRIGVVLSRQLGATEATGKVLIFLDSHCECTIGWLEPLLNRIYEDQTAVVTSVMDIIDDNTFAYKSFDAKSINIGGFDWNLQFTWIGIPDRVKKDRKSDIEPISSPTMPGGLFAISKDYFDRLGGFDPGMDMWGGENLEWSFKIWMCGGHLETIPCSHVGHLFRRGTSYRLGNSANTRKNFQRVAEVWMDEHKEHYYQKIGNKGENYGDISDRKKLRKKLECNPFDWYLKNVFPEMFIPGDAVVSGEIRNKEKGFADGSSFSACLDGTSGPTSSEHPVKIWPCHGQGGNQLWLLSKTGEIRRDDGCLDYSGSKVIVYPCHGQKGNQDWEYTSQLQIRHHSSNMCMSLSDDSRSLVMTTCAISSKQYWYWGRRTDRKVERIIQQKEEPNEELVQEIAEE